MRPYWKGYLKLALVSCPISLHAACSTAAIGCVSSSSMRKPAPAGVRHRPARGSSATPAPRKRA